tara:strand:+ start:540 stop:854 length:315 start_codon:yes stop_codon:yes gene_type:complete
MKNTSKYCGSLGFLFLFILSTTLSSIADNHKNGNENKSGKQKYFDKIDVDGNGVINKTEFRAHVAGWIEKQGSNLNIDRTTENGFSRRDTDKSGDLDFKEFSAP